VVRMDASRFMIWGWIIRPDYAPKPVQAQKNRPIEGRLLGFDFKRLALHQALWGRVMMVLQTILVANDLAVKFVHQFIDGSVQVSV